MEIKAPIAVTRADIPPIITEMPASPFATVATPIFPNPITPRLNAVKGIIMLPSPSNTILTALIPSLAICSNPGICMSNPIASTTTTKPPMIKPMSASPFKTVFGDGTEKALVLLPDFPPPNRERKAFKPVTKGLESFHKRNAPPIKPTTIKILPRFVLNKSAQLFISPVIPSHSFILSTISCTLEFTALSIKL